MEGKAKIIIRRPDEWLNRGRPFKVFIDGEEAGSLMNGKAEEFILAPGNHRIQCTLSWYTSAEFLVSLRPNDVEYLVAQGAMKYYWPLFYLLVAGVALNIYFAYTHTAKPLWASVIQLLMILPALLYMLYYLTAARKQHIILEVDKENIFVS